MIRFLSGLVVWSLIYAVGVYFVGTSSTFLRCEVDVFDSKTGVGPLPLFQDRLFLKVEEWVWWARPFRFNKPYSIDIRNENKTYWTFAYGRNTSGSGDSVGFESPSNDSGTIDLLSGAILVRTQIRVYRGQCKKATALF
jgi:hypothetical protein